MIHKGSSTIKSSMFTHKFQLWCGNQSSTHSLALLYTFPASPFITLPFLYLVINATLDYLPLSKHTQTYSFHCLSLGFLSIWNFSSPQTSTSSNSSTKAISYMKSLSPTHTKVYSAPNSKTIWFVFFMMQTVVSHSCLISLSWCTIA